MSTSKDKKIRLRSDRPICRRMRPTPGPPAFPPRRNPRRPWKPSQVNVTPPMYGVTGQDGAQSSRSTIFTTPSFTVTGTLCPPVSRTTSFRLPSFCQSTLTSRALRWRPRCYPRARSHRGQPGKRLLSSSRTSNLKGSWTSQSQTPSFVPALPCPQPPAHGARLSGLSPA